MSVIVIDDETPSHGSPMRASNSADGPPVLVPDGLIQSQPSAMPSEENQVTITILDNGDVQIVDAKRNIFLVSKDVLQQENIDTNNLTDVSIGILLQLTLPPGNDSQYQHLPQNVHSQQHLQPNNPAIGGSDGPQNRRKRRAKEVFDPSSIDGPNNMNNNKHAKRQMPYKIYGTKPKAPVNHPRPSFFNGNTSAQKPPASVDATISSNNEEGNPVLNLAKLNSGVAIYKPKSLKASTEGQGKAEIPRFCCAICDKPIPKTKVDFILLRLPAHVNCAKNTMMVISDSEDVEDDNDETEENVKEPVA